MKIEFIIDFPIELVLKKRYFDYQADVAIDPFINEVLVFDKFTNEQQKEKFGSDSIDNHGIDVSLNLFYFPWPLSPRIMLYSTMFYYDKENDWVYRIVKTCEHDIFPIIGDGTTYDCTTNKKGSKKNRFAYFWKGIAIIAFKKIGENSTKISHLHFANFGGWLEKDGFFTRLMTKKRAETVYQSNVDLFSKDLTEDEEKQLKTSERGKVVMKICEEMIK